MEIATFETLEEFKAVQNMCKDLPADFIHIGGMTLTGKSNDDWYWVTNGAKINYTMEWKAGEPNFISNNEYCLSIGGNNHQFNDITCITYEKKFICQIEA